MMQGRCRGIALAGAVMLAGCATGPEPELVAVVVPPPVYATDLPPAGLDEAWWRGFGDPALNDLVARGLAANLDIRILKKISLNGQLAKLVCLQALIMIYLTAFLLQRNGMQSKRQNGK